MSNYSLTPSPFPMPKGRAYTPDEKRDVIEAVLAAWISCKDMRLGQLLCNVMPAEKDLFYAEDAYLVDLVDEYKNKLVGV